MSDAFSRILAVLEEIRREREKNDARPIPQVRSDAVQRIAQDRDVRPSGLLEAIVMELTPDITSVTALEHAIDSWLNGSGQLDRIMKRRARDQIDARNVAEFFRTPVGSRKTEAAGAPEAARSGAPRARKKTKSGRNGEAPPARTPAPSAAQADDTEDQTRMRAEADAAARATAESRARADAAERAAAEARMQAEAAARAADEARAAAAAAAEAEARARAEAEARAKAEADAAQADDDARAKAEADAAQADDAARAGERDRTIILDEDVAAFFADESAVNDFLRAAIAAMRTAGRSAKE